MPSANILSSAKPHIRTMSPEQRIAYREQLRSSVFKRYQNSTFDFEVSHLPPLANRYDDANRFNNTSYFTVSFDPKTALISGKSNGNIAVDHQENLAALFNVIQNLNLDLQKLGKPAAHISVTVQSFRQKETPYALLYEITYELKDKDYSSLIAYSPSDSDRKRTFELMEDPNKGIIIVSDSKEADGDAQKTAQFLANVGVKNVDVSYYEPGAKDAHRRLKVSRGKLEQENAELAASVSQLSTEVTTLTGQLQSANDEKRKAEGNAYRAEQMVASKQAEIGRLEKRMTAMDADRDTHLRESNAQRKLVTALEDALSSIKGLLEKAHFGNRGDKITDAKAEIEEAETQVHPPKAQ